MHQSLQNRLTRTYIALAIIPLVILGVFVIWQGFVYQQESLAQQQQLAKRVSAEVNSALTGIANQLNLLIELEGGQGLREKEALSPLINLLAYEDIFEELIYVDEFGVKNNHETRIGVTTGDDLENYQNNASFQIPFRDGTSYFSSIYVYPATTEPVLSISLPVISPQDGRVEGVFIAIARLTRLIEIVENTPMDKGQTLYITDANGWVIAHANRSVVLRQLTFAPPRPGGITEGLETSPVLRAIEPVQIGQQTLNVVVEQSIFDAFALQINTIGMTVLISLAALGFAVWTGLRSVRQIVHPIQDLAKSARAIQEGEWQHQVFVQSQDEVGDLAHAFNLMVTGLQESLKNLESEIQERALAEDALRSIETRFRTLVEQLPAITYIDDICENVGMTTYVSPQIETILGYTQQEWRSLSLDEWLRMIYLEDRTQFKKSYEACYQEGIPLNCEFRMYTKGGELLWMNDRAVRLLDKNNQPWILQGVLLDITERKKAEEEFRHFNAELEQRVRERTRQLEAANQELESFTYSISHDLRTPLRGIIGFSTLLLNNPNNQISLDGQHHLNRVRENAQRMGQMVDDLLRFARLSRQPISKHSVDLAALAEDVLNDLALDIDGRKINISVQDLPRQYADPSLLRQVYTNLISNAIKYTRNNETAEIIIGWNKDKDRPIFFVRDNGTGFDMQYANKLFGVFSRLHNLEDFEGTGVGLAITHRIIQGHGGKIWAEAKIDQGATFYFTLGGDPLELGPF